jgi:hypothetical protein
MNRKLLWQVNEALGMLIVDTQGHISIGPHGVRLQLRAMEAVQEELKKAEPDPVAWMVEPVNGVAHKSLGRNLVFDEPIQKSDWIITPLYRKEV